MMKLEEKQEITPICPYCQESLSEVWCRKLESTFGKRYIYFCSRCRKALGVTHRKGFWMG